MLLSKKSDLANPAVRNALVQELRKLDEEEREDTVARARKNGLPLTGKTEDGAAFSLQGFDGNTPRYHISNNAQAAISSGASVIRNQLPYNVSGAGQRIGLWEVGGHPLVGHQMFGGRIAVQDGAAVTQSHATHVAGTLIGQDFGNLTGIAGMAPAATVNAYNSTSDTTEMTAAGAASPGLVNQLYVSNHSYGYICGWSGTDYYGSFSNNGTYEPTVDVATGFGRYEAIGVTIDGLLRNLPYYLPFFSAANDRDDTAPANGTTWRHMLEPPVSYVYSSASHPRADFADKGGYDTLPQQAVAKNVMTVGAVDDAVLADLRNTASAAMAPFSSWGPTDDGRIKPDVVANGISVLSASDLGANMLRHDSGTSMAAPNAAGSALLLVDYYGRRFPGQSMRAATLKGLIIHTADDLGTAGPDYQTGWGLINVQTAASQIQRHADNAAYRGIIEDTLDSGNTTDTHTFTWDGTGPVRVTLSWTDPGGTAQTAHDSHTSVLVNNLDLTVTAPTTPATTLFRPFVMPYVGNWTVGTLGQAATTGVNNSDNVEQVLIITPPVAGVYTINVTCPELTSTQAYSLIVSGQREDALSIKPQDLAPVDAFNATRTMAGTVTPASRTYVLRNTGATGINWSAATTEAWVSVAPSSGSLSAGQTATLTCAFEPAANALPPGGYNSLLTVTNTTTGYSKVTDIGLNVAASGRGTGAGSIADGSGAFQGTAVYGADRVITIPVTGVTANVNRLALNINLQHTWLNDLDVRLRSPGGIEHTIFSRVGAATAETDFAGSYTFADNGTNLWTAASGAGSNVVPSGLYRTSNSAGTLTSLNTAFAGLTPAQANGNWTLLARDGFELETGTIISASLSVDSSASTSVVSLTRAGNRYSNTAIASWRLAFSFPVTGVTAANFSLSGTTSGASIGTPASLDGGLTWTIPVTAGTDGNLTLNLQNSTGIAGGLATTLPVAGETYVVDRTAPAVTIGAPSATVTSTASVTYTVTCADTNLRSATLQAPYITINRTGSANAVAAVTGSGTTRTVTLSSVSGTGTLGISVTPASATDLAGNAAGTGGPSTTFTVDNSGPVVSSVTSTSANGTYGTGSVIPIEITFNEAATVTGTPALALNSGGSASAAYSSGSGTTKLIFDYTVAAGQSALDLNYSSTSALTLEGGTIRDALGNNASLTLPAVAGASSLGGSKNLVIDTAGPAITGVTSSLANGTYGTGAVVPIQVTFAEAVTVTGTPTLALNSGGSASASYASGSGSAVLTFNYTVLAGHNVADLNYSSTTALSLSGGTIKDASNNAATLTLPGLASTSSLGGSKAIVINTVGAVVSSVTSTLTNGTYSTLTATTTVPVTVNFNKVVTVTGTPTLALNSGGTASYASGSGTSALIFTCPIQAGHNATDLDYTSTTALDTAGGSIRDALNNSATLTLAAPGATGSLGAIKAIVVDTTAPVVTISPTGSYSKTSPITFTISFSETPVGFAAADIDVTGGGKGTLAGSGLTRTIPVTPSGQGPVTCAVAASKITDGGLNPNAASNVASVIYDNIRPTVAVGAPSVSSANTGPVSFEVVYSDANPVTPTLTNAQVTLNKPAAVTVGSVVVSGTGNARTVTLSSIAGNGTLGITIAANTATDAATNANLVSSASALVAIDNSAPTITANTGSLPANATSLTINGTGFSSTDTVTLDNGAAAAISSSTSTQLVVNFTALPETAGLLKAVVTDLAGNSSALTTVATVKPVVIPSATRLRGSTATLWIHGFGFSGTPANNSVVLSGALAGTFTPATASPGSLALNLSGLGSGPLYAVVTVNGHSSGTAVQVSGGLAGPGDVDDFNPSVQKIFAVQPDGKIIAGGSTVRRYHPDGAVDTSFAAVTLGSFNSALGVSGLVLQDGKILIGSSFGSVNSVTRYHLARLNANGSLDTSFDAQIGQMGVLTDLPTNDIPYGVWICSLAQQADGKIIIGGTLNTVAGVARRRLARLHPDGSLDTGFDPCVNIPNNEWYDVPNVNSISVQSDGRIVIGGLFTTLQPNGAASPVPQYNFARLNADGSIDSSFTNPMPTGSVHTTALQSDGKILLGGYFTSVQPGGTGPALVQKYVARLNTDGSIDTTLNPRPDRAVFCVAVQSDGRIVLAGSFTSCQPPGYSTPAAFSRMIRLNGDGTVDSTLPAPTFQHSVYTDSVEINYLALERDSSLLFQGLFNSVTPAGSGTPLGRNGVCRVFTDLGSESLVTPSLSEVLWSRAGALPDVSLVTFEQSTDGGASWTSLGLGSRVGTTASWQLTGLSLPPSGPLAVRARGRPSGAPGNLVEKIAPP